MCLSSTLPSHHPKARDQLVPGQVLACLWIQFHRLQRHSFLASGVCPLLGEAGQGTCESYMVGGLVPAGG